MVQHVRMGDLIVIHAHRLGEPRRKGVIVEVFGTAEQEQYRVRWDDGRVALLYPGGDALVQHAERAEDERVLVHEP